MKQKLLKTILLLFALVVGSGSAWADDITYKLTLTKDDFSTTSYAANDGSHSKDAVCTTDGTKKYSVSYTTSNVMQSSSSIQFKKNTGYLFNSTNLGTITNVKITSSQGTLTTWYGTEAHPTSGTTVGNGFFTIKETGNSKAGLATEIEVTFKFTIPTVTFNNSSVIVGETLDLDDIFDSNSDGSVTYTITAGGTYGSIGVDGHTLTGLAEGSVTVKASQAAKGIYADKEVTATISVVSASSPNVVLGESSLAFGEVEVGQSKELTFTVTPANLTGDLTIGSNNAKYTVSPTSISQSATTAQTITVTATPTALNDDMSGSITISGGGITTQYVALSTTPYQVSNVTLTATNGVIQQSGVTKTSITSRVGNTVTLTAVPNTGYLFDGWTAEGATPASSNTAETEFTLSATSVTLTANFIVDPYRYASLDSDDMDDMDNKGTGYGNVKSITIDGLTWSADAYQESSTTKNKMLQLRVRTNANGVSYVKLPVFPGYIQTITFSVTTASANSKGADQTTTVLQFQTGDTKNETIIASSASTSSSTKTIDLSALLTKYQTGYITASAGIRIWDINVSYLPTESVTISPAGWATLYTQGALDFSGVAGLTAYTATLSDNTVTLTAVNDVPANTGVVLRGAEDAYNIPVITSSSTAKGDLQGNATESTAYNAVTGKDLYMLALNGDNEAQFTKVTSGSIAAGKAYLAVAQSGGVKAFNVVFDDATGIQSVDNEQLTIDNSAIYNLAGQRLNRLQKGINIVNGKKVLVK